MSQNVLQFQCTACHAVLTVPLHMAGVTGPCPKCGATVTSPSAPPPQEVPLSFPEVKAVAAPPPVQPPASPSAPPAPPSPVPPPAPVAQAAPPPAQPTFPQASAWSQPAASLAPQASAPVAPPAGSWGTQPESMAKSAPPSDPLAGHARPDPTPPSAHLPAGIPPQSTPAPGSPLGTNLPPRRLPDRAAPSGSLLRHVTAGVSGALRSQAPAFGGIPSAPPVSPSTPSAPAGLDAPPHTSSVQSDPMAELLRGGSAQETAAAASLGLGLGREPEAAMGSGPSPFPPHLSLKLGQEKRSGSRLISAVVILAVLGGLGYAGWHFSEPIKQLALQYFPSDSAEPTVEEPAPPATPEPEPQGTVMKAEPATPPGTFDPGEKAPPAPQPPPPTQAVTPPLTPPTPTATADVPKAEPVSPERAMVPAPSSTATGPDVSIVEVKPGEVVKPAAAATASVTSPKAESGIVVKAEPQAQPAAKALQAFFAAPNLTERMKYTLGAASLQPLMTRYYEKMADGVIDVTEISQLRFDETPQTGGGAHCVFTVSSKLWEFPIPVMLQEEGGTFKVDWLAFVEFRDNLLFKFLSSYQEDPARFHVGIRRTHYFENDVPDLEGKDCFEIQPPLPTYVGYVFVPKNTPLAADLAGRISWETSKAYVIVELRWRKLGNDKWVELTGVPQLNWYSYPLGTKPSAPKAKPAAP